MAVGLVILTGESWHDISILMTFQVEFGVVLLSALKKMMVCTKINFHQSKL